MALQPHEQFLAALERSSRPLIVLSKHANVDDFVSTFAVASLLAKLQKPVEIASAGGTIPKSIQFLRCPTPIRGDLPNIRKLTLAVNTKSAKVDELSYEVQGDELLISLIPKTGAWNEGDVRVSTDQYRYDLIISIGVPDLNALGELFQLYGDFFFSVPIINIDHQSANEHFGHLNFVDMGAVSCSEICHDLFSRIDKTLIDEEVATFLLTGMIFKTKSFRSPQVTPKTLKIAGDLIASGARRDEIVEHLYKTRTVETLRLWGRALARLKSTEDQSFVWTLLSRQDFIASTVGEEALENIMDELLTSSPNVKVALIIFEDDKGQINGIIHADRPHDALYLGAPFRASGTREEVHIRLSDRDIITAEKNVIAHIKKQLT